MSLLDFLRPQQAQVPGQQSPFQNLLAPEVALPTAMMLMGGQGNAQNFANAAGVLGPALGQQKELQAQTADKNRTVDFFRKNAPEYAAMIDAGMPVGDAWQTYTKQRFASPDQIADNRPASIQEWEYSQKNPAYAEYLKSGKGRDAVLTATEKKEIFSAEDEIPMLDNTIAALDRAAELNDKTYTGFGAGTAGWLGTTMPGAGMVFDQGKAAATSEFGKLMSMEAIQSMAQTLKGATTDQELARFVDILADPSTPPDIRSRTIARMKQLAERVRQTKQSRIDQLRGGDYYQPGGGGGQTQPTGNRTSTGVQWSVEP